MHIINEFLLFNVQKFCTPCGRTFFLSLYVDVYGSVYVCGSVCIGALTFTTLSSCCIFYNMFHRTHQFCAYPKATTKSALPHFVAHFKLSEINWYHYRGGERVTDSLSTLYISLSSPLRFPNVPIIKTGVKQWRKPLKKIPLEVSAGNQTVLEPALN